MSTQPGIGLSYPDGGKVASYHGAPLVANDSNTVPAFGSHPFGAFAVPSWETLDINGVCDSGTCYLLLTFSDDAGGTVLAGQVEIVMNAGTIVTENVPITGSYVSITMQNQTAASAHYSALSIVGRQGAALPPALNNEMGMAHIAASIPATSTTTASAIIVRGGLATVSFWLSGANVTGRVFAIDHSGTSRQIWGTDGIASPVRGSEPLLLPPCPVFIQVQNTDAAAHAAMLALSWPDRYGS